MITLLYYNSYKEFRPNFVESMGNMSRHSLLLSVIMNVNETSCAKLNFSQWLSVKKNSYGEFHDNLKSGLIVDIRFRDTDGQGGREKDHKAIYSIIYQ
jgi:hypothetical protein